MQPCLGADDYEEDERAASEAASLHAFAQADPLGTPSGKVKPGAQELMLRSPDTSPAATASTLCSGPSPAKATSISAASSSASVPSQGKPCAACSRVATKGIWCDMHKRVCDNVYNEQKKIKDTDPDRWQKFLQNRKKVTPEFITMLVAAEVTKAGAGRGVKTSTFNAMSMIETLRQRTSVDASCLMKQFNARKYINKCAEDFGWSAAEAGAEFQRLLAATDPSQVFQRPTLPGKKMEPWIYIHDEDQLVTSQGLEHHRDMQLAEKAKKNPTEKDIIAAEQDIGTSGIDFSDKFFSHMSSASQAIKAVREGPGSNVMDGFGRTSVFGTGTSHRERGTAEAESTDQTRKKAKAFDIEEANESLQARLRKKMDATLKYCDDTILEIQDFFAGENIESKDKLGRVMGHLSSRLELVKVVSVRPVEELLADLKVFDGDQDELNKLVPDSKRKQYSDIYTVKNMCLELKQKHESDPNFLKDEAEWLPKLTEAIASVASLDADACLSEVLSSTLSTLGWAGSGFEKTPDLGNTIDSFDGLLFILWLQCRHAAVWQDFEKTGKPMMDSTLFQQVKPVFAIQALSEARLCNIKSEDDLKNAENDLKAMMDLVKTMVAQVRQTLTSAQKQSRELRRESAKAATRMEQDREKAVKRQSKEEKARLRQIADQMKGNEKLPGLLAFCGDWVKHMRTFKDLTDLKACKDLNSAEPYAVNDVPTLRAEEQSAAARVNFQLFKAPLGPTCRVGVSTF